MKEGLGEVGSLPRLTLNRKKESLLKKNLFMTVPFSKNPKPQENVIEIGISESLTKPKWPKKLVVLKRETFV